jgi:hypothetical protein
MKDEVIEQFGISHIEKLHYLYESHSIIRILAMKGLCMWIIGRRQEQEIHIEFQKRNHLGKHLF